MRRTFKSDDLQNQLDTIGYVIIDNVLTDEKMKELEKFYMDADAVRKDKDHANISSIHDPEIRPKMWELVVDSFKPMVEEYFDNHHQIAGHFITKTPGPNTKMSIHQGFTVVDEAKYRSINIWVPLIDVVDIEIGPMECIRGTHLLKNQYRSHTLNTPYSRLFPDFAFCDTKLRTSSTAADVQLGQVLNTKFETLPIKRGQCLIFVTNLLHRSLEMKKNVVRIAAAGLLAPKEASLYHYYGTPEGRIEEYEVDLDFFKTYNQGDRPERYKKLRTFDYDTKNIQPEDEELLRKIADLPRVPEPPVGFIGKLKKLFAQ